MHRPRVKAASRSRPTAVYPCSTNPIRSHTASLATSNPSARTRVHRVPGRRNASWLGKQDASAACLGCHGPGADPIGEALGPGPFPSSPSGRRMGHALRSTTERGRRSLRTYFLASAGSLG